VTLSFDLTRASSGLQQRHVRVVSNVLDPQRQQRQQHSHCFLLVSAAVEGEGQVVDLPDSKHLRQLLRDDHQRAGRALLAGVSGCHGGGQRRGFLVASKPPCPALLARAQFHTELPVEPVHGVDSGPKRHSWDLKQQCPL